MPKQKDVKPENLVFLPFETDESKIPKEQLKLHRRCPECRTFSIPRDSRNKICIGCWADIGLRKRYSLTYNV